MRRYVSGAMIAILHLGPALHAQSLHTDFSAVLSEVVRDGLVDYQEIKTDERFRRYLNQLSQTDPDAIRDKADRLAFWINAYNAFTIELIVDHLPVQSIREITVGETGPWDIVWIGIGGELYSLNQIEHEIIRKQFNEPLIHMALVCAAISCPPLLSEAYTGERLKEQMEHSARLFLADTTKNRYDETTRTLYLSELFQWYGDDFTARYGSAVRFALGVIGVAESDGISVRYLPYNWNLNIR
ncbi:MAG: DUF547 domain-containing protein [Ignavibacteria bacterium]|nr:DUF547 domain-containing protein [Ignavibacteria bacterium]